MAKLSASRRLTASERTGYNTNGAATCAAQAEADARHRTRRLQATEACEGAGLQNMVAACCAADGPGQNGGHRRVRAAAPGLAGPGGPDWPDARARARRRSCRPAATPSPPPFGPSRGRIRALGVSRSEKSGL